MREERSTSGADSAGLSPGAAPVVLMTTHAESSKFPRDSVSEALLRLACRDPAAEEACLSVKGTQLLTKRGERFFPLELDRPSSLAGKPPRTGTISSLPAATKQQRHRIECVRLGAAHERRRRCEARGLSVYYAATRGCMFVPFPSAQSSSIRSSRGGCECAIAKERQEVHARQ